MLRLRRRFEVPKGGIPNRALTSVTADFRSCEYATNGGFFDMTNGDAEGNVVVNSTVISAVNVSRANVGLTASGFVIGYVPGDFKTCFALKMCDLGGHASYKTPYT